MNNEILFEIAKYVESDDRALSGHKLQQALASREARLRRFFASQEIIERRMATRADLSRLREMNIYRERTGVDFGHIHAKLEGVLAKQRPKTGAFSHGRISPRLARIAKRLDFELRKSALRNLL